MPVRVTDLSDLERVAADPALRDGFKLAERFGKAVRVHFRGRGVDPEAVIDAAMAAVQAALREYPEAMRAEAFQALHDRLQWFEEFLAGVGQLPEGEA